MDILAKLKVKPRYGQVLMHLVNLLGNIIVKVGNIELQVSEGQVDLQDGLKKNG
jgi:hypothetical protein